jgi:hypothetical protein
MLLQWHWPVVFRFERLPSGPESVLRRVPLSLENVLKRPLLRQHDLLVSLAPDLTNSEYVAGFRQQR